jgi:hypothetical protein
MVRSAAFRNPAKGKPFRNKVPGHQPRYSVNIQEPVLLPV